MEGESSRETKEMLDVLCDPRGESIWERVNEMWSGKKIAFKKKKGEKAKKLYI